jgi:hypothetical protein
MTAERWDDSRDPRSMLDLLGNRASDRKLRLFAVACCRQRSLFDGMSPPNGEALVVAERFADGEASLAELRAAAKAAETLGPAACCGEEAALAARRWIRWVGLRAQWDRSCLALGVGLLRCLFGNPFRPVALPSDLFGWHGGLLGSMARRMYESRDFAELPVLADMLEDAGCGDVRVLEHCRGPGPHARGCFVVDHLLARS